jgi:carboxyl-terminal processing protease
MILDLRNDPGGYLDAAVKIASEFFKDGIIVEQKGKVSSRFFQVEKPGRLLDIPLVVLVNGGSASASEIVSGAIQARGRGKLVGVNTFGKGTVQDAQELPGGAGIHITTARWLLPNGAWIHEQGLKPDVEVEYDQEASKDQKWDNQVTVAIQELLSFVTMQQ